ncbi:Endonuclease MutS2 [Dirofilaria immitis]
MSERKKGLTESELKQLRARFKKRQNKFTAITAAASPIDNHDGDEIFEKVDVEINPIIAERNEELFLTKEYSSLANVNETLARKSLLAKKLDAVSKSKTSPSQMSSKIIPTVVVERRKSSRKDSGTISSSSESKTVKIKSIESERKLTKREVKQDMDERKKQKDKGKKEKEEAKEKSACHEKFKTCQKRIKVSLKNHKKKEDIENVEKRKRMRDKIKKSDEKKLKNGDMLRTNAEESVLESYGEESKELVGASRKYELKSKTSKYDSDKSLIETASSQANIPRKQFSQSISDINLLLKPIEMAKKDQLLYEKMDDDIVLDTNVLQSLATDLTAESNKVNKDVIGEVIAKKLIEIEKKDQLSTEEDQIKEEKEIFVFFLFHDLGILNMIVVSETAKKIVEALTSSQVLGKVLTPEEAIILKDYFSQKIPLSEKVLATLDIALDKILRRAHEFHDDKQELNAFLKDRDSAKAKLLDALIAKKSNYLADLMTDASYYADRISKGLIDVYKLATEGILVARENFQYIQAAIGDTYRYSKDMAYRSAALTYETAARSKELAEIGASVGAQMTSDAAKMTLDAAIRGKELAEQSAAIGAKMTSDVAKMTLDAAIRGKELAEQSAAIGAKMTSDVAKMTLDTAIRGKELAEQGAAIGTKMTSDAAKMTYDVTNRGRELAEFSVAISAKMTQDVASKGLQIAEGTIHVASKGKEMIKDSLTAASNATLDLSETALEGAMQVTGLVEKKVQNLTSAMNQARSEIKKSGEWFLSFFQPSTTSKISDTSEIREKDDDSDDDSDKKGTNLLPNEKSGMENK